LGANVSIAVPFCQQAKPNIRKILFVATTIANRKLKTASGGALWLAHEKG